MTATTQGVTKNQQDNVSSSNSSLEDTSSLPSSDSSYFDDVGRMFCKHKRDYCHVCCVDHRHSNRAVEEAYGMRPKETKLEEAARMYAISLRALRQMEKMHPRPSEAVFEQNRRWGDQYKEILDQCEKNGEDVATILQKAKEKSNSDALEMEAMAQQLALIHKGQTEFELGGEECQVIHDKLQVGTTIPCGKRSSTIRADWYTCAYCGKTGKTKLLQCSRCKLVSYCGRDCQAAHWASHKKFECRKSKSKKEPKRKRLTWDQVEAHGGDPAPGKLEVKAIKDEGPKGKRKDEISSSALQHVFLCKDRVGTVRRVVAETDNRLIPSLSIGATITWKNPRFVHFRDGSSGARIQEEDLGNITVVASSLNSDSSEYGEEISLTSSQDSDSSESREEVSRISSEDSANMESRDP